MPAGIHVARCVRVFAFGLQSSTFGDTHVPMIGWEVEVPHEGRTETKRIVSQLFTSCLAPKATLRKTLESWRGHAFSEAELAGFDLFNILGAWRQIALVHSEPNERCEDYVNVTGVFPLGRATARFEAREQLIGISPDECRAPNAMDLIGRSLRSRVEAGHATLQSEGTGGAPNAGHDRSGMGQSGAASDRGQPSAPQNYIRQRPVDPPPRVRGGINDEILFCPSRLKPAQSGYVSDSRQ